MLLLDYLLFLKFMANIFLSLCSFYCVMVAVFSYSAKRQSIKTEHSCQPTPARPSSSFSKRVSENIIAFWVEAGRVISRQAESNYLAGNLWGKLWLMPLLS